MSPAKSDVLRSRLTEAGLSSDACTKYITTLKAFLNARLTKTKYEDEMSRVLPKDKIHVHNAIIHEMLYRAQQKREGIPNLPVLVPLKEKRPPQSRPVRPPPSKIPVPKTENGRSHKTGTKRPHEENELDRKQPNTISPSPTTPTINNIQSGRSSHIPPNENPSIPSPSVITAQPPSKKQKVARRNSENDKSRVTKPKLEKPSPKLGMNKRGVDKPISSSIAASASATTPIIPTNSIAKTISGNGISAAGSTPTIDIPTYDMLYFYPLRPGDDIDSDMYWRINQVVRRIATEQCGMNNVKDEAIVTIVEAVEIHLRNLIAAGAKQRAMRDGRIPKKHLVCGPIDARDIREVTRWNTGLLGEDPGLELERLLMLL